tara:strand:+ start:1057 stop:1398 length:342 start_codon:yes stop_codon:yes gene_type:complete
MLSWLYQSKVIYTLSNLLVLPATLIPFIDLLSNIAFIVCFVFLINTNIMLKLGLCMLIILKNNANYRFKLLLKQKGEDLSRSDYECVYLFAWCTLLRYLLIGLAANQIYLFFE